MGVWETVQRSTGGLGSTYELLPEGSLRVTVGVMLDYGYSVDGERVLTAEGGTFRLAGHTLIHEVTTFSWVRIGSRVPGEPAIVGRWVAPPPPRPSGSSPTAEGNERPSADPVPSYTFTEDGEFLVLDADTQETGTYTVDGDRLTLDSESVKLSGRFRMEGDSLSVTPERSMARSGPPQPGELPIVGKWTYEEPLYFHTPEQLAVANVSPMSYTFTRDGKVLWRIPIRTWTGRYSVSRDHLTLEHGSQKRTGRFRIEGDSLFFTQEGSTREQELRRATTFTSDE